MNRGLLLYCCAVAVMLGAVFGSFLNCAAWRIAHQLRRLAYCPWGVLPSRTQPLHKLRT